MRSALVYNDSLGLTDAYGHVLSHLDEKVYSRVVLISDGIASVGETEAENILA